MVVMNFIEWVIPDIPANVAEQIRREAYITNEIIIEQEALRARGVVNGSFIHCTVFQNRFN